MPANAFAVSRRATDRSIRKSPAGLIRLKDTTHALGNTCEIRNATRICSPASQTHQAENLMENARKSFMLAGAAHAPADIVRYAAIGRAYLERAHANACIDEQRPIRKTGA